MRDDTRGPSAPPSPAAGRSRTADVLVGALVVVVVTGGISAATLTTADEPLLRTAPSPAASVAPSDAPPAPASITPAPGSTAPAPASAARPTAAATSRGTPSTAVASPPAATPPSTPAAPAPPAAGGRGATPAPAWLGTRALAPAGSGPVPPQQTPPELRDRRLVTVDRLPPPTAADFAPQVSAVPEAVLARSTWRPGCPVAAGDLRYVLVPHWGFEGRAHTGELLVHADAVEAVVAVFAAMFDERFPLEEVRVVRADELDAAPTGDGNVTSVFVCRESVGGGRWSRHAYGRALDVNPFHNPYDRGDGDERLVLPELATAYTDRDRVLPGMLTPDSAAVRAAETAGWGWGGRWRSAKDWMHLSDDGS